MVGHLPCVLNSTTNNIRHLLFGCHVAVGDVAPGFHDVGSCFYPWAIAFVGRRSFPFISGHLHLWVVIFICRHLFVFISGHCCSQVVISYVGSGLHLWAVICVLGQSFSLEVVVGDGHSVVVVIGGIVVHWLW